MSQCRLSQSIFRYGTCHSVGYDSPSSGMVHAEHVSVVDVATA